MRDLADLLERLRGLSAADGGAGASAVLVTLVGTEGSSYRKPGARLLVEADGRLTGLLSGGCLEQDLLRLALETLAAGRARRIVYDLTGEEEVLWGFGTGCAGRLTLLLEPLDEELRRSTIAWLTTLLEERREIRAATLFAAEPDAEGASTADTRLGRLPHPPFTESLLPLSLNRNVLQALDDLCAGSAREMEWSRDGWRFRCLVESILPPPHLLVVGAGRDVPPLLRLAGELGWAATVVEPRPTDAAAARVAGLARYVGIAPAALAREVELSPRTAAVLATHRYLDDLAYLGELVGAPVAYLALLGPAARRERLLADLARQGRLASGAVADRVRGPAGLALGGRAPAEVALSIVAEIQSVLGGAHDGRAPADGVPPLSARRSDGRPAESRGARR